MSRRQRNLIGPQGMGGLVSSWGASSLFKSIQTGTRNMQSATTVNETISAVDTNNAICLTRGSQYTTDADANDHTFYYARLASSTLVEMVRVGGGSGTITCTYTVLEFRPGLIKSLQAGTITLGGGQTSNTATITSVDTGKSVCLWAGNANAAGSSQASAYGTLTLTNATTVTVARNTGVAGIVTAYVIVEFF